MSFFKTWPVTFSNAKRRITFSQNDSIETIQSKRSISASKFDPLPTPLSEPWKLEHMCGRQISPENPQPHKHTHKWVPFTNMFFRSRPNERQTAAGKICTGYERMKMLFKMKNWHGEKKREREKAESFLFCLRSGWNTQIKLARNQTRLGKRFRLFQQCFRKKAKGFSSSWFL